ncbi:MAG: hypothetical protein HY395_00235 [Candidatus Doudnabacteria bacterium]|nr:hypothetical protein [Candidatus Doudnabacteria bacterium]
MAAKFAVDGDQDREIDVRICEIKRQLRQASGSPLDPAKVAGALQAISEGKFAETPEVGVPVIKPASRLIQGLFVPSAKQVDDVRKWSKERGWGFSEEQMQQALATAPAWPSYQLCVAVLVPYLDTSARTFEALWTIAASRQEDNWRYGGLQSRVDQLRYLDDGAHAPGLSWEIIDLVANWDKKYGIAPASVRSARTSPSAGILASAAHFPKWVSKMDGVNVPFVWIPGYQASIPGYAAWAYVPLLSFDHCDRQVKLDADPGSSCYASYAVPQFRE